jgi:hypothetical protein
MPSNYLGFTVGYDKEDGVAPVVFAAQTVKVRDITNSADLADLTSDGNGIVPNGTLSVAAGTAVRFYFQITSGTYKGVGAFYEQVTT